MEARRSHQGNEAPHRVEAYPTEVSAPVHGREFRDGFRLGVQGVDRRAEGADGGGGGAAHGGFASGVNLRATRRRRPARSIPDRWVSRYSPKTRSEPHRRSAKEQLGYPAGGSVHTLSYGWRFVTSPL